MKTRRSISDITEQLQAVTDLLESSGQRWAITGSIRRGKREIQDVDIVVCRLRPILDILSTWTPEDLRFAPYYSFNVKQTFRFGLDNVQFDLFGTDDWSWGSTILCSTGSTPFVRDLSKYAKDQRMKLSPYGLFDSSGYLCGAREEEIFQALGLPYIQPQDRELFVLGG